MFLKLWFCCGQTDLHPEKHNNFNVALKIMIFYLKNINIIKKVLKYEKL